MSMIIRLGRVYFSRLVRVLLCQCALVWHCYLICFKIIDTLILLDTFWAYIILENLKTVRTLLNKCFSKYPCLKDFLRRQFIGTVWPQLCGCAIQLSESEDGLKIILLFVMYIFILKHLLLFSWIFQRNLGL